MPSYVAAHRRWVEVGYYYCDETGEEVVVVADTIDEVDWDTLGVGYHETDFLGKVDLGTNFDFELLYCSCN